MTGNSRVELVHRFFSGTGPTYDFMANLCTVGFDRWWKKKILTRIPEKPARIMDQACGTGILTLAIARKFPQCRVIGVELRDEYLHIAREKAQALKSSNVEFILGRAEDILLNERFDCITSSYLAKYAELKKLIPNNKSMLRVGGILIMHDFTYPPNRPFARIWELYFRLLQTAGSRAYPQWRNIFYGLPGLMRETKWVAELVHSLRENDLTDIHVQSLTWGTSTVITARRG